MAALRPIATLSWSQSRSLSLELPRKLHAIGLQRCIREATSSCWPTLFAAASTMAAIVTGEDDGPGDLTEVAARRPRGLCAELSRACRNGWRERLARPVPEIAFCRWQCRNLQRTLVGTYGEPDNQAVACEGGCSGVVFTRTYINSLQHPHHFFFPLPFFFSGLPFISTTAFFSSRITVVSLSHFFASAAFAFAALLKRGRLLARECGRGELVHLARVELLCRQRLASARALQQPSKGRVEAGRSSPP